MLQRGAWWCKSKPMQVRIEKKLQKPLRELAEQNRRTVPKELNLALFQWIILHDAKQPRKSAQQPAR